MVVVVLPSLSVIFLLSRRPSTRALEFFSEPARSVYFWTSRCSDIGVWVVVDVDVVVGVDVVEVEVEVDVEVVVVCAHAASGIAEMARIRSLFFMAMPPS